MQQHEMRRFEQQVFEVRRERAGSRTARPTGQLL